MLAYLQSHLVNIIVLLAIMGGLGILIKKVPDYLAGKAAEYLDKLFVAGDPADDELLCGLIRYAEKKYGAGMGAAKATAVVNKLISMLPPQYAIFATAKIRAKTVEFFQTAFDRLKAVALKEVQEHGIPADSVPPIPGA